MEKILGNWYKSSIGNLGISFICGYCGSNAGPSNYYFVDRSSEVKNPPSIYICPKCNRPTYIFKDEQVPGPIIGDDIEFLPIDVEQLYNEARKCISVNAYTSAVLSCRKLLMNTSVTKGAESGKGFVYYVNYLEENHYIPPDSREWVDMIRKKGNEATHAIPSISKEDAIEMLEFTSMLLRFVYELPGKMTKYKK
ncbi:DUF4145 domain-containing protein [Robertmurraya siralis]|uniref:DUF4145 domain-containing protein n=1 Tax=Robertmurraya siralis TaxID=77777 RepID=UPI001476C967|nr:DUF4145 domain-containing protein [Robertmurraya siralis]